MSLHASPFTQPFPNLGVQTPMELAIRIANRPDHGGKWFLVSQGKEPGIYATWYVLLLNIPAAHLI